jgi:hypothetical protein
VSDRNDEHLFTKLPLLFSEGLRILLSALDENKGKKYIKGHSKMTSEQVESQRQKGIHIIKPIGKNF